MSEANSALDLCQKYVNQVEGKNLSGVEETLADNSQQIFLHTKRVKEAGIFAEVCSGKLKGVVVAVLKGKPDIMAYTKGLMDNFQKVKWIDTRWEVSATGHEVYFFGKGDMITAKSGKPYRNVYVTRFDVRQGHIVEINEIGDAMLYMGLGILPNAAQLLGFGRALLRPLGIGAH